MTHPIDLPWEPDTGSDESYALFAKERRVVADDGTPIAYTVRGGDGDRVPVLFANGWSCSDAYWGGLLTALEERGHPCILPDTRGHGGSGLPRSPGRGARHLTIDDVATARIGRDLLTVADHAGYDQVLVVGHSMGVQTALELYRLAPERVLGQVLIAGTFENPVKTFYGTSIGDRLFPLMAGHHALVPRGREACAGHHRPTQGRPHRRPAWPGRPARRPPPSPSTPLDDFVARRVAPAAGKKRRPRAVARNAKRTSDGASAPRSRAATDPTIPGGLRMMLPGPPPRRGDGDLTTLERLLNSSADRQAERRPPRDIWRRDSKKSTST